jgi:hypothetical protein
MTRIHFIEGDTDSLFWAISGDPEEDNSQQFKHVIKDHSFYNAHVYNYLPASFYSSDNSNPKFDSPIDKACFNKKVLGLSIEGEPCDSIIALAAKRYTCFDGDSTNKIVCNGYKRDKKNIKPTDLSHKDYGVIINEHSLVKRTNHNLQLHDGVMSHISVEKNVLTAAHTKYKVSKDFSTCVPLFFDIAE